MYCFILFAIKKAMRNYIIIFLLLTSCQSKHEWFIWNESSAEIRDSIVIENLDYVSHFPHEFIGDYLNQFHILDFDDDKDLDIIFQGFSGAESECFRVILNENGTFEEKLFVWGEIQKVTKNENDLILTFIEYGCCGDVEERLKRLKLNVSKDSIFKTNSEMIVYHSDIASNDNEFEKPRKFQIINKNYHLRVTPEINNTEWFSPDSIGNSYLIYNENDQGIALGEKADKTGRIWWYVRMNATDKHARINHDTDEKIQPFFEGWMSSKYLTEIKNGR